MPCSCTNGRNSSPDEPVPEFNTDTDDEAEFMHILNLQASGARCTVQQYQFKEKTAELALNYGTTVGVWQYPESYWNRYLTWKQAHSL